VAESLSAAAVTRRWASGGGKIDIGDVKIAASEPDITGMPEI